MSTEQPRVVYLGPKYTFSHEAAVALFPDGDLSHVSTFREVFSLVDQENSDFGVLPVENSSTGVIPDTYQLLLGQSYEGVGQDVRVKIIRELLLPINHNLLAAQPLEIAGIERLYTHRQPELQCGVFIGQHLAGVDVIETLSTADAGFRAQKDSASACIGSDLLAVELKLIKIKSAIQDVQRNVTRFVAVSVSQPAVKPNKTTFAVILPDKPGMLVEALQLLASQEINLTSIKTLPIHDSQIFPEEFKDWFVMDVGSADTSQKFRRFARKRADKSEVFLAYKNLGSYPTFNRGGPRRGAALGPGTPPKAPKDDEWSRLISLGESGEVEFKATLRYDLRQAKVNKDLGKVVAKTIAAFMNSDGGVLFIGVGDGGEPIGVEADIQELRKKDEDGFLQALFQIVIDMIGTEFCQLVVPAFIDYGGARVCAVRVGISPQPAWLADGGATTFFVRAGNSSRPLDAKSALDYVLRRSRGV